MGLREQQARMQEQAKLRQAQREIPHNAITLPSVTQSAVLIALEQDVQKIRHFSSFAERNAYKRDHFLPKWLPFVEQHFNDGRVDQNDVIGYCLVYLLDVGHFERAFSLAEQAIKNGQRLPERFSSPIATFMAKHMLDWVLHQSAIGRAVEPYFSQTLQKVATQWQLNEVLTSLWFKQAAIQLLKNASGKAHAASISDPVRISLAMQLLRKAFFLNPKSGVTSLINRCEMRLNVLLEQLVQAGIAINNFKNPAKQVAVAGYNPEIEIEQVVEWLNRPPRSFEQVIEAMRGENA